jgi:hypothetical protein
VARCTSKSLRARASSIRRRRSRIRDVGSSTADAVGD